MSERKLKAWQEAGLIDAATAQGIRDYEAKEARPLGLWALIGLGALAIGLGLVSVVAANWDAIPGLLRLFLHMGSMICLGVFIWLRGFGDSIGDFFHDALLFILAALGLTFFAHLGQVYQTSSPLWQPLALWLLLFTPLLLLSGRSWLIALLWTVGLVGTAWAHGIFMLDRINDDPPILYLGLITSVPLIGVTLGAAMRGRSERPDFWRRIEQTGFAVTIFGVSFSLIAVGLGGDFWGDGLNRAFGIAGLQSLCLLAVAGVVATARKTVSGAATAIILVIAGVLNLLGLVAQHSSLGGALLFMTLWGVITAQSLRAGWRGVFQIAVAVLALRLIVLSFELASDLLGSGIGLILAGVSTLGIAWVAVRITRQYAPKSEVAA
jgi:Predicted membrane protein (DUF2157)